MERCIECGQEMSEEKIFSHKVGINAVYRYTCICGFTTSKSKNSDLSINIKINPYGYCNHRESLNGYCLSCGEDIEN